jgi:D-xylulose reductase
MRFGATPPCDGTLTDVYLSPEDFCHKLPANVSLEEGALLEPLSVAAHIVVKQAQVKMGDNVIVFGAGPIGLLCCAVAKAYGAQRIVAVDINASRLAFAKRYAATNVVDAQIHSGTGAVESARLQSVADTSLKQQTKLILHGCAPDLNTKYARACD